jgi:hypothetical protein
MKRIKRVSVGYGTLFHERFLGREQRRIKLALRRRERAIYGESSCCA